RRSRLGRRGGFLVRDGRRTWSIVGLTAPAYLWLTLAVFLPLSAMLYFSFLTQVPFGGREASLTLQHYRTFWELDFYPLLTWRSIKLGLHVTAWCLVLGYPAAYALARTVKGRWRESLFLLVILPFWSNSLVRVYSWTIVLRSDGLLDRLVQWLFPGAGPLNLLFSYPAIVIGLVHAFLPYMILTTYVALQSIDERLLEAAQSLGARPWTVFARVVFPLSLPGVIAGVVLIFVPVIGVFMEPRVLGGRAGTMLGTVIEEQFVQAFNWPFGAALSFILLAVVLLLLAVFYP